MKPLDKEKLCRSLEDELNGVALYRALADAEKNPNLAEVFRRIADSEQRHADHLAGMLRKSGVEPPEFGTSWRTRVLGWLANRFGVGLVLPTVFSLENADSTKYYSQAVPESMAADEASHARLIREISKVRGGVEGRVLARGEGRHRLSGGNTLRAAVLGANDGLVSNLSLIMGVAGASLSDSTILITGIAGLLAGACSMALGEWLSVQSARELYENQIAIEQFEIETAPEEEKEELALIYQAKGLDKQQAQELAEQVMSDPEKGLDTLVREELGIDPKNLGGSAWQAAITSFLLFAVGAIIPVAPYFFLDDRAAMIASLIFSLLGLFAFGAGASLFTARGVLFSGTRQAVFGLAAAIITFVVGKLIGVSIS